MIRNSYVLIMAAIIVAQMLPQESRAAHFFALADSVPPNVLIALDNSGSMGGQAYNKHSWRPNSSSPYGDTLWMPVSGHAHYYGYFDNDSSYDYASSTFISSDTGAWPGWLLNWVTMSRTDVLRKVLVGGKYSSNILGAECVTSWTKYYITTSTANYNRFNVSNSGGSTQVTATRTGMAPINATLASAMVHVAAPIPFRGVIHELADKDSDAVWDSNIPRFGLWDYNNLEGGKIVSYINDPTLIDLVNATQNINPDGWTPLAENHFEIVHYFAQSSPHYFSNDFTPQIGGTHDPFYDKDSLIMRPCVKSFVLLLVDGESTEDQNVPGYSGADSCVHLPNASNVGYFFNGPSQPDPPGSWGSNGTGMLDDVALYGHTMDLRGDLPGKQEVSLCGVYCFGTGSELLKSAAKAGAFRDINGDNLPGPDSIEWDENHDGIPDFYYEATDGWQMEAAITNAIQMMMTYSTCMPTPALSSPTNAQIITYNTPSLHWCMLGGATQYRVQVATDSLFATYEVNSLTVSSDTVYYCSTLPNGGHYWRVKAYSAVDSTPWSDIWHFSIDTQGPSVPALINPTNHSAQASCTAAFMWHACTDLSAIDRYVLSYAIDSLFIYGNDSVVTMDTSVTVVLSDTGYYWKVKVFDQFGHMTVSPMWFFVIDTLAPNAPVVISPPNGGWVGDSTVIFTWELVNRYNIGAKAAPISYILQVDTSCNFMSISACDTTASVTDTIILKDNIYYWRVKAFDGAGHVGPWSFIMRFEVDVTRPFVPEPIAPYTNSWLPDTQLVFAWAPVVKLDEGKAAPVRYIVQVDTSAAFPSPLVDTANITLDTCILTEGSYWWRVRAYDLAGNQGVFSIARTFGIDTSAPLIQFTSSLPDDPTPPYGPYLVQCTAWDRCGLQNAWLFYQINGGLWDSTSMSAQTDTLYDSIPESSVPIYQSWSVIYYIKAVDLLGHVQCSSADTFSMLGPIGVAGGPGSTVPGSFVLDGSYPNPTRGSTTFKYRLPKACMTRLEIYNMVGQLVHRFDVGMKQPGLHQIEWRPDRIPQGVYFYRLSAGTFTAIKKLTILK